MNQILEKAIKHWNYIAPVVNRPSNDDDLKKLESYLDELLDTVGNNENHPLIGLVDTISDIIASYEKETDQKSVGKGIDALKYLMDSNDLRQSDLGEIISQGVLSEILNGKRSLNLNHITQLAKFFHVSPETFID